MRYSKTFLTIINNVLQGINFTKHIIISSYPEIVHLNNLQYFIENIKNRVETVNLTNFSENRLIWVKTENWKTRKTLVLKINSYLCQFCPENKAIKAHYKSYKY